MTGMKFGRLTVLRDTPRKKYVVCKCDCGAMLEIRADSLVRATCPTRSCGCLQREAASNTGRKTIATNARAQIDTNVRYHTNFQVIESQTPPKNNRSGHKGVSWDKSRGLWEAYITVHKKRIHLGRFCDYDDAVKARKTAEENLFLPLIEQKREEVKLA